MVRGRRGHDHLSKLRCPFALFFLQVWGAATCFLLPVPILTLPVPGDTYVAILFDREEIGNAYIKALHEGKAIFQQSLTAQNHLAGRDARFLG